MYVDSRYHLTGHKDVGSSLGGKRVVQVIHMCYYVLVKNPGSEDQDFKIRINI